MSYTFRIRFNRSPHNTIQSEAPELIVSVPEMGTTVSLRNPKIDQPIKDADQLVLLSDGYSSEKEAIEAGLRFQHVLMVALARVRVGADFGERAPKCMYTNYGLNMLAEQIGQRVLNNVHGLTVFPSEPKPRFVSLNGVGIRGVSPDIFQAVFVSSIAQQPSMTNRDLLAYSLFNASFFQPTADSRFLLLVMAVEALIETVPRSPEGLDHVNRLIEETLSANLPGIEKDSMIGTLSWLRNESINQAGKRLTSNRLGSRLYGDKSAPEFFSYCYQLRSNLVHGNLPIPTFEEVGNVTGILELFVSDLLTIPILGYPQ